MKHGFFRWLPAFLLFLALPGEAGSTPYLMPYALKSNVVLEDGYGFQLEVCGKNLCRLEILMPGGKVSLSAKELSDIIDPDILSAKLYTNYGKRAGAVIIFEVPLFDFDAEERSSTKKVAVFEFEASKLKKFRMENRAVRNPD